MLIPFRHKILYGLALIHLVMVMLFASHFAEWGPMHNPVSRSFSTVGYYTGSNNIFSFFAPGLSDQPYVIYTIRYADGHEEVFDFTGNSPEFTNRINNIYGYLTIEEGRQVFSASLAQAVMRQHEDAQKIRVAMVIQVIPSMTEYQEGQRSRWRFWFHQDFQKDSLVTVNQQPLGK